MMLLPIAVGILALILLVLTKRELFFTANSSRLDGPAYPLNAGESAAAIVRAPMFWVGPVGITVLYTLGSIFLK